MSTYKLGGVRPERVDVLLQMVLRNHDPCGHQALPPGFHMGENQARVFFRQRAGGLQKAVLEGEN